MRMEEHLEEWVKAYCRKELSADERAELTRWLEESREHERLFRKQLKLEIYVSAAGNWKKLEEREEGGWKRLHAALFGRRKRLVRLGMRAAAVVLLGIGVYAGWKMQQGEVPEEERVANVLQTEAGTVKASLQLASGTTLELTGEESRHLVSENHVDVIQEAGGGVRFEEQEEGDEEQDAGVNVLTVPVSGEYFIVLGDGTKVWVNSDSRLEFATRFGKESREVALYGEAYFEVARDESRPFFVRTGDARIRVLGTSFNVTAYQEEQEVKVGLLQGKVRLETEKNTCVLKPGEIATLDRQTGGTSVSKGDVEALAAWRTGRFDFEDMALEELATKLYRWYGVRFEFEDAETRVMRFSGVVMKNWRLDYALDVVGRTTRVAFVEKEGKIFVYSKQ